MHQKYLLPLLCMEVEYFFIIAYTFITAVMILSISSSDKIASLILIFFFVCNVVKTYLHIGIRWNTFTKWNMIDAFWLIDSGILEGFEHLSMKEDTENKLQCMCVFFLSYLIENSPYFPLDAETHHNVTDSCCYSQWDCFYRAWSGANQTHPTSFVLWPLPKCMCFDFLMLYSS